MKHLILLLTLFALMLAPLAAQAQEPAELEVPPCLDNYPDARLSDGVHLYSGSEIPAFLQDEISPEHHGSICHVSCISYGCGSCQRIYTLNFCHYWRYILDVEGNLYCGYSHASFHCSEYC